MDMHKKVFITSLIASNIYAQEECSIIKNDQKRLDCYDSYFIKKPADIITQAIEVARNNKNSVDETIKKGSINITPEKTKSSKQKKQDFLEVEVLRVKLSPTNKHTIYGENITFKFQESISEKLKIKPGDNVRVYEGLFGYHASVGKKNRKYSIKIL